MIGPDRTVAPPFQLSDNYSLTQPEKFILSGGQPLYAYRDLKQNVVKLELVFRAGKWFESQSGLSYFTGHLLTKGTLKRNSYQLATVLDGLGAHLEVAPGFDEVALSLFVLKKNFFAALELLMEIIQSPAFNEDELRQQKEIFIQNLQVNNEKTNVVASKEIRKSIFGTTHPYGNSTEENDVERITGDAIRAFYHASFQLQSCYFLGALNDSEMKQFLDTFHHSSTPFTTSIHHSLQPGVSKSLTKSGSVQASIRLGKRCIRKANQSDYFDAVMFNHILGGYFGSRLMKNIREEKGLTYGIYSGMNHFNVDSFWVISAEVSQQHTQEAIDEIRNEIHLLQEEPVPMDELTVARNYFIGSWQSDNATLFAVAEKVKSIHSFGLPPDYYTHLLGHMQRITPGQIQRVAREQFAIDDLIEVRVG